MLTDEVIVEGWSPAPPLHEPTRVERAWAAGFFDGEGSVSINRYQRKTGGLTASCRASIGQLDPILLVKFQQILGIGIILGPYRKHSSLMYEWRAYGYDNVEHARKLLWPYLGPFKRKDFKRVCSDARRHKRKQEGRIFTHDEIKDIRLRHAGGEPQAALAKEFTELKGFLVTRSRIWSIVHRRTYKELLGGNL